MRRIRHVGWRFPVCGEGKSKIAGRAYRIRLFFFPHFFFFFAHFALLFLGEKPAGIRFGGHAPIQALQLALMQLLKRSD